MQKSDCSENKDTLSKFENLEITEPISLESLTSAPHKLLEECSKSDTSRIVHSDPEQTQTKVKTRSRFSNALRKLSRTARKKEKSSFRSHSSTATESSEQIISSGAEDLLEGNLSPEAEKKSKKKKRSLFSLRRSKVASKSDDLKIKFEQEEQKTEKLLEPIFQDNENEVVVTTERLTPVTARSKVQITIKSKKIETLASKEPTIKNPSNSSPPPPTNQTNNDTLTIQSNDLLDKKKNLKTKPITQTPQKSTITTTTTAQSKSKQREEEKEQITITQSSKDTPPKERAPTKPSRLTASTTTPTSQASASSGTIRKTATTTRAALKLAASAKSKQKSQSSKAAKGSKNTQSTDAKEATYKETDLMINPQRGHRLPRPTSTTTITSLDTSNEAQVEAATSITVGDTITTAKVEATTEDTLPTTTDTSKESQFEAAAATATATPSAVEDTAKTINTNKESQLKVPSAIAEYTTATLNTNKEFQLEAAAATAENTTATININKEFQLETTSAASSAEIQATDQTTATLPTISSNLIETKTNTHDRLTTFESLPQTSTEIRSSLTNASLETPPPPITTATIPTAPSTTTTTTSADITTTRQQQQENIQLLPIDNSNSVQLKPFPETDDHISRAESVRPGEDLGSIYNDTLEAVKEPVSVHFAVGSPVRAPFQQSLYEYSVDEPSIGSQKYSDENSEASRLPIHYISQSTLYDEINSLELRRSRYRHQSGVSDLSLDTCENRDTFDDPQQMPAFGDLTMDQDTEPTVMTSTNAEKREHLYKILVIGELGTGKTSFIKRYVHQFFSQNYRATIGVDFALKVLHWDPNTIVRLQLWDIAGQERFGNMTRVYYKEAVGAFIVFDVTRSGTFDCVSKWKEDLDSKVQLPDGSPIPCILLANKCDQDKQGVVTNTEKMDEYVKEHGFAGWFETSAKENVNIDEAARALVNKILLNDKLISAADLADSEKFNLNNSADQSALDGKSKCSC